MIIEDYVSFETAKLLNEKGFDEYCWYIYMIFGSSTPRVVSRVFMSGERSVVNNEDIKLVADKYGWEPYSEDDKYAVLCPSLQMAMKWLREVHKVEIWVHYDIDKTTWWGECNPMYEEDEENSNVFQNLLRFDYPGKTYEEACEAAIKYCLENLI